MHACILKIVSKNDLTNDDEYEVNYYCCSSYYGKATLIRVSRMGGMLTSIVVKIPVQAILIAEKAREAGSPV